MPKWSVTFAKPNTIAPLFAGVDQVEGISRHEHLLERFLWESTFDTHLDEVSPAAEACGRDLAS